jgi:hypothetical protein
MTRAELIESVRLMAIPVEIDRLVYQGVLQKVRGGYKILDKSRLPKHAEMQIDGVTPDGVVRFVKSNKAAQKLLHKLTGTSAGS